jgi:hypothetical protein
MSKFLPKALRGKRKSRGMAERLLVAASIDSLGRQVRPTKRAIFGQFILALVSVVASFSAVWNTKLTSDSVKQLEEQRLANYRPSVFVSPLELTITARRENGSWKVEDRSQKSKVVGDEGPIKSMQLANVGKGAIEGLNFTWEYPKDSHDLSKFGLEIRREKGRAALYVDGAKFEAVWVEPQPSVVLPSDNEMRWVNFVADPIQFVMFDQIIKKIVQKSYSPESSDGLKEIGLIRGSQLILKYRNIEGNIYTQKFNFYFQPYHYTVEYNNQGLASLVEYKVSVVVEPDGIEPPSRPILSLHLRE